MVVVWRLAIGLAVPACPYLGYLLLLRLLALWRSPRLPATSWPKWPLISFSLPAYNEGAWMAATLERILEVDYPADRRQILQLSLVSRDRTDEIVRNGNVQSFGARLAGQAPSTALRRPQRWSASS